MTCTSHMELLLTKRLLGIMGQAPNWLYGMTDNGRNYLKLLDAMQSFTAKVLREKKAEREKINYKMMELKVLAIKRILLWASVRFFKCFDLNINSSLRVAYVLFKLESSKVFLDKLLDTAEETGDLNEENILNQADTFMFVHVHVHRNLCYPSQRRSLPRSRVLQT